MIPKITLTDELRAALERHPGGAIEVEDEQTNQVYVLVERRAYGPVDETLRELIQVGLDQSDRGESEPLEDIEDFLKEARRRWEERRTPPLETRST